MSDTERDSDESAPESADVTFPDGVDPRDDRDRFLTHSSHGKKHVYQQKGGEFRSACGSHTIEDPADLEVVNARELLLAHVLWGDKGIDTSVCTRCRNTADLDKYVSPETWRSFVEGELDEEGESALPEIDAEYIPISLSLDAEIQIPANERAYKLMEAVGKAAASQTALDRTDTIAVEGEVIEDESDDSG